MLLGNTVNSIKPDKLIRRDICTEKNDKSKENNYRFSSQLLSRNDTSGSLYLEALSKSENKIFNLTRENEPSKPQFSTAALNITKNLVSDCSQIKSSKTVEYIGACFALSKKISKSAVNTDHECRNNEYITNSGFDDKRRISSCLLSNEEVTKDGRPQVPKSTETSPQSFTVKSSSESNDHQSSVHNDEWSHLAQTKYTENTPYIQFKGGLNPSRFVQIRKNPCAVKLHCQDVNSTDFCNGDNPYFAIPRNKFKSLVSSENQKSQDHGWIDSKIQSTPIVGDKCSSNMQTTHNRRLTLKATKSNSQEQEMQDDATTNSKKSCLDFNSEYERDTISSSGTTSSTEERSSLLQKEFGSCIYNDNLEVDSPIDSIVQPERCQTSNVYLSALADYDDLAINSPKERGTTKENTFLYSSPEIKKSHHKKKMHS